MLVYQCDFVYGQLIMRYVSKGYMTCKGELIRAILFPKPIHFRFYQDLVQVAMLFTVFGFGGMIYSMYNWITNGVFLNESSIWF